MQDTPSHRPRPETVLGFDYGAARIGVAVAQLPEGIASPLQVLSCSGGQPDWKLMGELVREWRPQRLVVGIPTRMDGSDSDITRSARRFARRLAHRTGVTVVEADERLSSRAAESELAERRRSGNGRRRDAQMIDAIAARIILEQWLHDQENENV